MNVEFSPKAYLQPTYYFTKIKQTITTAAAAAIWKLRNPPKKVNDNNEIEGSFVVLCGGEQSNCFQSLLRTEKIRNQMDWIEVKIMCTYVGTSAENTHNFVYA